MNIRLDSIDAISTYLEKVSGELSYSTDKVNRDALYIAKIKQQLSCSQINRCTNIQTTGAPPSQLPDFQTSERSATSRQLGSKSSLIGPRPTLQPEAGGRAGPSLLAEWTVPGTARLYCL